MPTLPIYLGYELCTRDGIRTHLTKGTSLKGLRLDQNRPHGHLYINFINL